MNKTRCHSRSKEYSTIREWRLWLLDVYFEKVLLSESEKLAVISRLLEEIEDKYLTDEFNHLKVGFVLLHFGRRGTTFSIWHWAEWGGTYEVFNQAWYCYSHNIEEIEILGVEEPVLCNLDCEVIFSEIRRFKEICDNFERVEDVIRRYLI